MADAFEGGTAAFFEVGFFENGFFEAVFFDDDFREVAFGDLPDFFFELDLAILVLNILVSLR
jgi:hypothetical protein